MHPQVLLYTHVEILTFLLTVNGVPAMQHLYQHKGSSLMAFQSWPRSPSSRRRRRYSLCVNLGQCRSCSSGPSLLHFHGKTITCTVQWASSGQTCKQCGSPSRCVSWNTQWPPFRGTNTASQLGLRGAGSIGCHCHRTWGCRLVLGAGKPA